jgi:hypothetical protein
MRIMFADTFYGPALLNPRDSSHSEALTGDRHFRQAGFVPLLHEP